MTPLQTLRKIIFEANWAISSGGKQAYDLFGSFSLHTNRYRIHQVMGDYLHEHVIVFPWFNIPFLRKTPQINFVFPFNSRNRASN